MRAFAFVMVIAIFTGFGAAQTTRPVGDTPPQWERMVSSLTAAVVAHDTDAAQALLGGGCRVGRFFAEPDADSGQFLDAVSAYTVLGDHAYVQPAAGLAADIAHDVNSSNIVSDFEKKALNLNDKRARSIVANQLMTQTLNAGDGELVGIIVLWDGRAETDDQHRLIFVLIKGEKKSDGAEDEGGGIRFTRIVYGDPLLQ